MSKRGFGDNNMAEGRRWHFGIFRKAPGGESYIEWRVREEKDRKEMINKFKEDAGRKFRGKEG